MNLLLIKQQQRYSGHGFKLVHKYNKKGSESPLLPSYKCEVASNAQANNQ